MKFSEDGVVNQFFVDDGKLIINRRIDNIDSLFTRNREMAEIAPSKMGDAAMRYVGSIDPITAERWSKECGAAIGTQEFMAYLKRKLMDSDNSKFLVKGF